MIVAALGGCAKVERLGELFQPDIYVVQRGDSLYSIAWRYQLDDDELIRWNGLSPPYAIQPGQRIRLAPPAEEPTATAPARPPTPVPPATGPASPVPAAAAPQVLPESRDTPALPVPLNRAPRRWIWPAEGPVARDFSATDPGRKGLGIGGSEGAPVVAAADGMVVYSGNGLPAYGNLIIVRHDEVYLSAYAYNRELLVAEGDSVRQGQAIAYMGVDENRRALLHFEIRKNGKPVDPQTLLPGR